MFSRQDWNYHDIFENIENIENIMIFFWIFVIFSIFSSKMKISNKLYNYGCNTLVQYLMSYQSFLPYVKISF